MTDSGAKLHRSVTIMLKIGLEDVQGTTKSTRKKSKEPKIGDLTKNFNIRYLDIFD